MHHLAVGAAGTRLVKAQVGVAVLADMKVRADLNYGLVADCCDSRSFSSSTAQRRQLRIVLT